MACILPPPPDRSRGAEVDGLEAYEALVFWVAESERGDDAEAPLAEGIPTERVARTPPRAIEELPTLPMPSASP